jgi:hypothetical protein
MNHNQMKQTDTPQQASYICQTPQQAYSAGNTSNYIYASNTHTTSTIQLHTIHTSQAKQQAEHQPKQQTAQKQKKERAAMTMTTGYPGKQLEEEARKEQAPEPQKCQQ